MIHHQLLITAAAAVLLASAPAAFAADPAPAGDAKEGYRLFTTYGCSLCHGVQGQGGGRIPHLAPSPLPREAIETQLRTPRGRMPNYSAVVLNEAQVDDIVAYLHTIPAGKRAQDIALLNIQ